MRAPVICMILPISNVICITSYTLCFWWKRVYLEFGATELWHSCLSICSIELCACVLYIFPISFQLSFEKSIGWAAKQNFAIDRHWDNQVMCMHVRERKISLYYYTERSVFVFRWKSLFVKINNISFDRLIWPHSAVFFLFSTYRHRHK